ncbi:MAG: helicase-exonuclease AddAB subunit AddA [Lachnospiraceae bacterium]|nr:helicase-exonuclease AddAB subunit AddA [Lachnospiraceae bacterium]
MAIKFTDDQQKVIDIRDKNVLVSAAAGSGKTAVLVERIVSLVCDEKNKTDIDELLVVTFTKAAAAEMRERVCKRIGEKLEENPSSAHLQKQYTLVHRAMITTIDSFCQNVLRNHFSKIDFDPDFRVMDEGEKELMRRDVLETLLEEKYASGDEDFLAAAMFFSAGKNNDSEFESEILELQEFSESFAWPEKYLLERKDDHADTLNSLKEKPIGIFFYRYLKGITEGYISDYERMLALCDKEYGPEKYKDMLTDELGVLLDVKNVKDTTGILNVIKRYTETVGTLNRYSTGFKKGEENSFEVTKKEELKTECTGLRNNVKDGAKDLIKEFLTPGLEEKAAISDKCAPYMDTLIDITVEFRRRFLAEKKEKHVVDFGDLEHFALDILVSEDGKPTSAASEYREHFKEIMVDEYQDSNLVQDVILDAISSDDPLKYDRFMVGDVKQSIYGFRQARPDLFLEKYDTYKEKEGCERIDLSMNFRSRKEVIDSVNEIFERIMHQKTGSIEYDKASRLNMGASYPEAEGLKTELILMDSAITDEINGGENYKDSSDNKDKRDNDSGDEIKNDSSDDDGDYRKEEAESLVLANLVRKAMSGYVTEVIKTDEGEVKRLRPVRYSDIVILHRSPSKIAEPLGKIFEEEGIPVSITQGGGYFSAPEVRCVLQLIRTINNPLSDIPLYGSLISVFGGLNESEVARVKAKYPEDNLWTAVKKELPDFANKISRYRKTSTYRSIRELLQLIFDEHDYIEYVTALPAGAKRRANIEMLLNYASDFEKTSYYGLFHFIRYIDQLQKYTTDNTSEADVLGENADVVRLMSIHKSKGLEFPITILAGMGKKFNFMDTTAKIVHDNELGLGCDYIDLENMTKYKSIRKEIIAKKLKEDTLAEELRLLYVAMTRAKEKLIMVGKIKNAEKVFKKIKESSPDELSYGKFIAAASYFDFVLPVVGECGSIDISHIKADDIQIGKISKQLDNEDKKIALERAEEMADFKELKKIEERFDYVYPFENLSKLYTKTTVSELKMAAMLDEDETAYEKFESRETEKYIPEFKRENKGITGTVRGNSYHRVMEIMDFDRTAGKAVGGRIDTYEQYSKLLSEKALELKRCLNEFLEEELREHRISDECFEAVNQSKIIKFLESKLAFRMWKSVEKNELFREQPFVLSLPASKVNNDFPESENVIIQGIIDAYFVEDGKIVLLDYKTDSVENVNELVKRYETQLDYYEEALERLTGLKVSERVLYSFSLGEEVTC